MREGHTVYEQHCIAVQQDKDGQIPVERDDKRVKTLTQSGDERNCDGQKKRSKSRRTREGNIAKATWGQETR